MDVVESGAESATKVAAINRIPQSREHQTFHQGPDSLLPDSVTSYTLSDDGKFVVNLKKACYIQFDYLVYYEKKITGKLSIGSISNLKGIQVKMFFLWFDVDKIKVDLLPFDSIYFTVGFINKELDVDQF
ncbi:unnamed protein product [Fraxinus pennsylvanica]|uniref:Uncharacterized protein n=1 Tax=Fraxinus pennsylvanica TaxID=56036 RepID=A0AAD2DLX2_9LAMI|nr:unnamed protein product [Fraxinus pennsylvanica]